MSWSRLPASYEGPEQEQVYTLMDDPRDAAEDMKKRLFSAATHLDTYADIIQGISLDLLILEDEAWEFRAEAQAGYEEAKPKSGSPNAPSFGTEMKEVAWWEHSPARQRNEELLGRHAVLIEKVSNAVTYCANRINELQLGTLEESYTPVTADQILNSSEPMPWGSPDPEPKNCGQSVAVGAGTWAKDTWYGATSFFGFDGDPTTPRGATAGQAWLGTVDFISAATVAISPVSYLAYVPGISDTEPAQVIKDRHRTARDGVGAMVGWDGAEAAAGGDGWHQWKDDPVAMGTQVGIDAVLIAVPIGGWAAGAGKAGIKGSRAAGATRRGGKTTRVAGGALDFLVPGGGRLVEGASTVFTKRLSASNGRTSVLDEVDLAETAPPAVPRDRTATDDSPKWGDSASEPVERTEPHTERERADSKGRENELAERQDAGRSGVGADRGSRHRGWGENSSWATDRLESSSDRRTLSVSEAEAEGIPKWTSEDVHRAREEAMGDGEVPLDPRTGVPLNEAGGRRNWEMRWDPVDEKWVAQNRGAGWGESGPPIDDPDPVRFDPTAGHRYESGDAHYPGAPEPHTPPETYRAGGHEPGVEYKTRSSGVKDEGWRAYQEQISGLKPTADGRIPEITVPDPVTPERTVSFDGRTHRGDPPQEVYLEAKRGYEILDRAPYSQRAEGMRHNLLEELRRQMRVLPKGAELEWHVSTARGATTIRNIVDEYELINDVNFDELTIIATDQV